MQSLFIEGRKLAIRDKLEYNMHDYTKDEGKDGKVHCQILQ